ncbi:MAG: hypothetical protein JNK38_00800 [Acidobacteria bacterium]|nr:hypothetical protein [Acidobacteriota bacterium]
MAGKMGHSGYEFSPEAMLPAWFVTDEELVIKEWHEPGYDLLLSVGKENDLSAHRLSVRLSPEIEYESLWQWILDRSDENFEYIGEAIRVLEEHIAILQEFSKTDLPRPIELLVEQLEKVEGLQQVVIPYIYPPKTGRRQLRLGFKISPVQGLKLMEAAKQDGGAEYVDLVVACRLKTIWEGDLLRRVDFLGVQPVLHDATERHRLWETTREEIKATEEAKVTQFLSHAFKTPLANTQRLLNTIRLPGLDQALRNELSLELESLITDVDHLASLLLFVNTAEKIRAPVRLLSAGEPTDWPRITLDDIRYVVATTLQSVHNKRTGKQGDVEKVELLFAQHDIAVPSRDLYLEGLTPYRQLAQALISTVDFAADGAFAICPFVESGRLGTSDVAKNAKTTLLNLLLTELIVNALKNASETEPRLSVQIALNREPEQLELRVFNNGAVMLPQDVKKLDRLMAETPGEKRKALGWFLNRQATTVFDWDFFGRQPEESGTLLVVGLPLDRQAANEA